MEDIDFIKISFETNYKPTYISGTPHYASKKEYYFLSEDEYNKVIDFIKTMKGK